MSLGGTHEVSALYILSMEKNPCGGYVCVVACKLVWIYIAEVWRDSACYVLIHSVKKLKYSQDQSDLSKVTQHCYYCTA